MMSVLATDNPKGLKSLMQQLKVDSHGIKIMLPKAITYLVKTGLVSNIAANILKQEMLSLGGDVAVARGALTGEARKTACLIMGNLAQFNRLNEKLNKQPFGLESLAAELSQTLANYQKDNFIIDLGRYKLNTGRRTHIMGVVNLTPDSFSQDGLYQGEHLSMIDRDGSHQGNNKAINREPSLKMAAGTAPDRVVGFAERMVEDGADIIDVGGESSRPGAKPVPIKEELARVVPAIKALVKRIKVPVSIDTYKPQVAKQALDNGAAIVNDITGLTNNKMIKVAARYKAAVVIMHMKGKPRTMQRNPVYKDAVGEIIGFLGNAIDKALCGGIPKNKIIIDPGIGFGKTLKHNLEILKRLNEFKALGQPIMVGTSRKSFIGKVLNAEAKERIFGTVSSCVLAVKNGAHIVRVHDVNQVKQSLLVLESLNNI